MHIAPIFSLEERNKINEALREFECIKEKLKVFLAMLFPDGNLHSNHYPDAHLELIDDDVLVFKAFGRELQAQPEFIRKEFSWKVQYLFHVVETTLVKKKTLIPLYQVEIDTDGYLKIGGDEQVRSSGGWRHESYLYNRLKENLLCALLMWLGRSGTTSTEAET